MSGIAESGTTNTQSVLLKNIIDRNTLVWWALMLASVLIVCAVRFTIAHASELSVDAQYV